MDAVTVSRTDCPSPSALRVAALRALHQTLDQPVVFVDPLAARILGPAGATLIEHHRAKAGETARLRGTLAARHVTAESAIGAAVARGVRQCAIVGAGLDTYAYRHPHDGLTVYELDHPAMQAWKRDLLREAAIAIPETVRYVATDLETDDLRATLASAGFDLDRPAIFAMLGVTPYVARESIERLLRVVAGVGGGDAEIVFDYTEPFDDAPDAVRAIYAAIAARLAAGGEPWVSMFKPADLHAALAECGFGDIEDRDAAALHARFCVDRTDGLTIAPLVHLVRARTRPDCQGTPA